MFSGIIQHVGIVRATRETATGERLEVAAAKWGREVEAGESISVDGCCLTVAGIGSGGGGEMVVLEFDVIPQTLRATTLGALKEGARVNLEGSVTAGTLLSGHIVQGHVDGIGEVIDVAREGGEHRLRVRVDREYMELVVDKGSVALAGVSLTVASTGGDWFEVALIPTTLERTTLGELRKGERINVESDCVARMVVGYLKRSGVNRR